MLTLWTTLGSPLDCMPEDAAKNQVFQFVRLLCLIFLLFPYSPATAEGQILNFTGTYPDSGYRYVDVPFTLNSNAIVDITYDAACRNVANTDLYVRPGDLAGLPPDQLNFDLYNIVISHDEEPVTGYPLSRGNFIARISCAYGIDTDDPNWEINIVADPLNLTFAPEDPEPSSMESIVLNQSTSFSGWFGLWGVPDDPVFQQDNRLGHDLSDYKFYFLKKGTRIKFSASWESFTASTDKPSPSMNVWFELYRDGHTYFVTNFDLIENSGDETREIIVPEDGVYRVMARDVSWSDPKHYSAYKMDVILNGESIPGELILTFQSAEWVRQQNQSQEDSYNLVVNFQVENTYNESKIVRNFVSINAPGLKLVPDTERWDTETNDRAIILTYYAMMIAGEPHCGESSDGTLSKYCQYNRLGADYMYDDQESHNCLYYVSSPAFSPYYSIPPHGITDQTTLIPATLDEYRNFDESSQIIVLAIQDQAVHPGTVGNDGCHVHGQYFMPVRAFIPPVNNLLLNR